jgi:hypothetical protein
MSDYGGYLDRWLSSQFTRDDKKSDKLTEERQKYLDDPTLGEKIIAHNARVAVPSKKQEKIPIGADLAKVEKGIPSGDPRRGIGREIMADLPDLIKLNPDMHPRTVIAEAYKKRTGDVQEETFKYKRRQDASFIFKDDVAPAAGYEEWVGKKRAEPKPEWSWTNPIESFAFGAGTAGLGAALGTWGKKALAGGATNALARFAAKRGATALAGGVVGGVPGALIGAGAAAILEFGGFDVAQNLLRQSEWGRAHEGTLTELLGEGLVGIPAGIGVAKGISKLAGKYNVAKTIFGRAQEQMAVDPSLKTLTELDTAEKKLATIRSSAPKPGPGEGPFGGPGSEGPAEGVMYDLMEPGKWHNMRRTEKAHLATMADDITGSYGTKTTNVVKKPLKLEGDEVAKAADLAAQTGMSTDEAAVKVLQEKVGTQNIKTLGLRDYLNQRPDITRDPEKFSLAKRLHAAGETPEGILKVIDEQEALNTLDIGARIRTVSAQRERATRNKLTELGYTNVEEIPHGMAKKLIDRHPEMVARREGNKFLKETYGRQVNDRFILGETGINPEENVKQLDSIFEMGAKAQQESLISKQLPLKETVPVVEKGVTESLKIEPVVSSFTPKVGKEADSVFEHFMSFGTDVKGQEAVRALAEPHLVTKSSVTATAKQKTITEAFERYKDVILKKVPSEVDDIADTTRSILDGKLSKTVANKAYEQSLTDNMMGRASDEEHAVIEAVTKKGRGRPKKAQVEPIVEPTVQQPIKDFKIEPELTVSQRVIKARDVLRQRGWTNTLIGRITIDEADKILEEEAAKAVSGTGINKTLPLLIMGTGLVALGSMIGPNEAEAGVVDKASKMFVHPFIVQGERAAGKGWKDMIQDFVKLGMYSPEVNPLKPHEFPGFMHVPQVIPDIGQLIYRGASKFMDKIWSPSIVAERYYGATKDGIKAMSNPMVELGYREVAAQANARKFLEVSENILKDVPGYKTAKVDVAKRMESIENEFFNNPDKAKNLGVARYHASEIQFLESDKKNAIDYLIRKVARTKGEEKDVAETLLKSAQDKLDMHKKELLKYEPIRELYDKEVDRAYKELASKYSSTRIGLATEGVGMGEGGWLEPMLTKEERVAAGRMRDLYDTVGARMKEVGEAPIEKIPYIHHALHPKSDWKVLKSILNKETLDADGSYLMSHFHHRSYASKQMMPDISYINERYAPDAMKRIEMADFWKEGTKDGWAHHRQVINAQGYKGATEFWNGIDKAMAPVEKNTLTKMSRVLYSLEVARLLFMSPSVALKHAMKLEANMSNFGVGEALKMYPQTLNQTTKAYVSDFAKMTGMKGATRDLENEVLKTYTSNNRLMSVIQDMGLYDPPQTWTEKMLQKFNDKGASLVQFTERFDRAHSFLAAMDMASKKGMTAEQAAYGVMDTILKTNFLSGVQNPAWLRNPNVRLMMMFQGTPFKILEQRLLLAQRGGKDVVDALKTLKDIKADVKDGAEQAKMGMMKDAFMNELTKSKDMFGNPFSAQLGRKAAILGTIILGGRSLFDSDLTQHVMHIPGLKEGGKVSFNPILTAALEARANEDTDESWISSFFQKWLPSGPIPAIMVKGKRFSEDDIPERYRGGQFRYIFGIPTIPE